MFQSIISNTNHSLIKLTGASLFCEFCRCGKSCNLPFKLSESVSTKPLQLIYSDAWGPTPISSVCVDTCYVLFVDDFSKYTWVFSLKNKADVFDTFRLFKLKIENLFSFKIQMFCSDGGGEYLSSQF